MITRLEKSGLFGLFRCVFFVNVYHCVYVFLSILVLSLDVGFDCISS